MPLNITVLTHFLSPYQSELFDAVSRQGEFELKVIYLHQQHFTRQWEAGAQCHNAIFIKRDPLVLDQVKQLMIESDLVVFGYYKEWPVSQLINLRACSGKPWCFWGERPGYKMPLPLGRLYRRFRLRELHSSRAPIWGIGKWAIAGYKHEFGEDRQYFNVPYFSNLDKFIESNKSHHNSNQLRFLFSGTLSRRKGVDLLLTAFDNLTKEYDFIHLDLIGDGPLRKLVEKIADGNGRIAWHGFQHWEDLPAFYAKADILCVPSRYDGWGLVIPEGLAAGLPVIATNRMGAALDLIQPEVNGWLIAAGYRDELTRAISDAVQLNKQKLTTMSVNARETAKYCGLEQGVKTFHHAVHGTLRAWSGC